MNHPVKTKLVCICDLEAFQIGKNLIPALRSKKMAETGLDQWTVQNLAVKQMMEKHDFIHSFFMAISTGVVKAAAWGLLWRVSIGAMLSVADLATDVTVLVNFWRTDRMSYFQAGEMVRRCLPGKFVYLTPPQHLRAS
jgi:hypothetical protein